MLIYDKYILLKKLDEKFWRYILMFPPPPDFFKCIDDIDH